MPINVQNFTANYTRIVETSAWAFGELLNVADWSILWVLFVVSLVLPMQTHSWQQRLCLALLVGMPIALDATFFIFSSWGAFMDHVTSSLPRLILHTAPVAVLGIALSAPRLGRLGLASAGVPGAHQRPVARVRRQAVRSERTVREHVEV
jgi:hypothetical protein